MHASDCAVNNAPALTVGPCDCNPLTFHAANLWVLKIDPMGKITLNPDIPQDEAVHEFIKLCNRTPGSDEIARRNALLRDCAEHFKTLREANVFVWPNHPLNPEVRIAEMLRGT